MFGPLNFTEEKQTSLLEKPSQCPLCDDTFKLPQEIDIFMKHLFEAHDLVIEDLQHIPKLQNYLNFWHEKFQTSELSSIVPSLDIELPLEGSNEPNIVTNKKYYLLSTLMKEDKELRQRLRLENALDQQEFERTDENFTKNCLFCKLEFKGLRKDFLDHLSTQHNLQLGNPQNLVFIDDLLQAIQDKFDAFSCIYCEKIFPDRHTLKEHMRKKIHKRINPGNKSYDKFYIVNYTGNDDNEDALEPNEKKNSDSEYSDWTESDTLINCLFCDVSEPDIQKICLHMQSSHGFNFPQLAAHLDFYQRVKLVNFLRRQVHLKRCPRCDEKFQESAALRVHMKENGCFVLPEVALFDQPEYYFPTYENDAFLYYLEDVDD